MLNDVDKGINCRAWQDDMGGDAQRQKMQPSTMNPLSWELGLKEMKFAKAVPNKCQCNSEWERVSVPGLTKEQTTNSGWPASADTKGGSTDPNRVRYDMMACRSYYTGTDKKNKDGLPHLPGLWEMYSEKLWMNNKDPNIPDRRAARLYCPWWTVHRQCAPNIPAYQQNDGMHAAGVFLFLVCMLLMLHRRF